MTTLLLGALLLSQGVESPRSFSTGHYRNLFRELGKSEAEIDAKVQATWKQLFYGDDLTQRVYYPVGADMGYIKDLGSNDVRTEGMSYGMMIAVQLDHQPEFDRIWRWADTYMRNKTGPMKGYFAWQCAPDGHHKDSNPAPDGEEYFAMALFFADGRWGSKGAINYRKEANSILHAMLHRETTERNTPMFAPRQKLIYFSPNDPNSTLTDPSYHLPAFYDLWSRWADEDRSTWKQIADASRKFFHVAAHPVTGLAPNCCGFDGKPTSLAWDPNDHSDQFLSDAYRVAGNIAMDYAWFGVDPWQVEQSTRLLTFFRDQKPKYVSGYTVDGKPTLPYQSTGHRAMNAVAALASPPSLSKPFVQALWDDAIPSGQWRYYDGMLYTFGLLHASGNYRIWSPK